MKTLLFTLLLSLLSSTLLAEGNFAVQVIAVENKESITPPYMRIVHSLDTKNVKHLITTDGKWTKIQYQSFDTKKDAMNFCKLARENLSEDAFITMAKEVLIEHTKNVTNSMTKENKKGLTSLSPFDAKHCFYNNGFQQSIKLDRSIQKIKKRRREARENEIAKALDFYKNSKNYSF